MATGYSANCSMSYDTFAAYIDVTEAFIFNEIRYTN